VPKPTRPPAFPELAAELSRRDIRHGDLAAQVEVVTGIISKVLRGRVEPSHALRERIASVLDRPAEELFRRATFDEQSGYYAQLAGLGELDSTEVARHTADALKWVEPPIFADPASGFGRVELGGER
jgi:transcriptional regulator with XRE-family HTH domain